jgi:8-oxo-dGTP diphosphatase
MQIVAGIIRRGDEILLVEQQGRDDPTSSYALPGGRVEPGELLIDALAREVREETGLTMHNIARLAYLAQYTRIDASDIVTVFVFEIANWDGKIRVNDPDGFILQARFVPVPEAIDLLEKTLDYRVMREPIVAYLRGETRAGTLWFYRRQADGEDKLVAQNANSPYTSSLSP